MLSSSVLGWATGRASSLYKAWCLFIDSDDLTGSLHVLLSPPLSSYLFPIKSRMEILVLDNQVPPGKKAAKMEISRAVHILQCKTMTNSTSSAQCPPCYERQATCGSGRELGHRWNITFREVNHWRGDIHPETVPVLPYHLLYHTQYITNMTTMFHAAKDDYLFRYMWQYTAINLSNSKFIQSKSKLFSISE